MNKRSPMAAMPDLTGEIIEALAKSKDDFGFEMRVGRLLRNVSAAVVRHAEFYRDPRTGEERQFDYRCTVVSGWRRLQLAVECKNLFPDAPAVICGHTRSRAESFHDLVCAAAGVLRRLDNRGIEDGLVSEVARVGPASDLYPATNGTGTFVGKSVMCPRPPKNENERTKAPLFGYTVTNDGEVYDRWNQAVGSAGEMALQCLQFQPVSGGPSYALSVTLPIVVVPNESLWQLRFGDDGQPCEKPVRVDHTTLFRAQEVDVREKVGTPFYRTTTLSHVHFLTLRGLEDFLAGLSRADSKFWTDCFPIAPANNFTSRLTSI